MTRETFLIVRAMFYRDVANMLTGGATAVLAAS